MKIKLFSTVAIILFIYINHSFAQYNSNELELLFTYNYTTTSKLYLSPYAANPFDRAAHENLDDIYSVGGEIKYRISEPIVVGLNVEYLKREGVETQITGVKNHASVSVDVKDGYTLVPVELSVYYLLPFSSDKFKFYMGGGIGVYFGNHVRTFYGIDVANEKRKFSYGIQVGLGLEYLINKYFSVVGGMKFRDPEFELTSKYNAVSFTDEDGGEVILSEDTFDSKVNIDGVTFFLGVGIGIDLF